MIDLTGQTFGRLTVLKRDTEKKAAAVYWICQCECGKIKSIRGSSLTTKNKPTRSCGCLAKENHAIDTSSLIGQQFGRLTVLKRNLDVPYGKKYESQWYCQCSCGNIVSVRYSALVHQKTRSCGCLKKEMTSKRNTLDLTNKRYGNIIALENTEKLNDRGCYIWKCQCDCGKIFYDSSERLQSGHVNSCGCKIPKSRGEQRIKIILEQNKISFISQYRNNSCRNPKTNALLFFDFCIFEKNTNNILFLIEFDGRQHFEESDLCKDTLSERQFRDNYKDQWCKKNGYLLYRIPFYDLNKINTYDDLMQEKYLVK